MIEIYKINKNSRIVGVKVDRKKRTNEEWENEIKLIEKELER